MKITCALNTGIFLRAKTVAKASQECCLKYQLCSDWIFTDRYFGRLADDKVDAFGRVGDFNLGY